VLEDFALVNMQVHAPLLSITTKTFRVFLQAVLWQSVPACTPYEMQCHGLHPSYALVRDSARAQPPPSTRCRFAALICAAERPDILSASPDQK